MNSNNYYPVENLSEDSIRAKAYEIWQARGKGEGQAQDDWFTAIDSLKSTKNGKASWKLQFTAPLKLWRFTIEQKKDVKS